VAQALLLVAAQFAALATEPQATVNTTTKGQTWTKVSTYKMR